MRLTPLFGSKRCESVDTKSLRFACIAVVTSTTGVDLRRHYINEAPLPKPTVDSDRALLQRPRRLPKHLSKADKTAIVERLGAGATQVQLAEEYGVNRKTMMRSLKNRQVPSAVEPDQYRHAE